MRAAAEAVHAHRFIEALPQGYDTEVRERGATLSVGQKQLLSFARALAHDPRVLILDEATSSVDTETEELIQDALRVLLRGRTAIVIAHRLSTVQHVDEILVLHKGRVRERGTHQELLARRGMYWKLYQLQYREQEPGPRKPAPESRRPPPRAEAVARLAGRPATAAARSREASPTAVAQDRTPSGHQRRASRSRHRRPPSPAVGGRTPAPTSWNTRRSRGCCSTRLRGSTSRRLRCSSSARGTRRARRTARSSIAIAAAAAGRPTCSEWTYVSY